MHASTVYDAHRVVSAQPPTAVYSIPAMIYTFDLCACSILSFATTPITQHKSYTRSLAVTNGSFRTLCKENTFCLAINHAYRRHR